MDNNRYENETDVQVLRDRIAELEGKLEGANAAWLRARSQQLDGEDKVTRLSVIDYGKGGLAYERYNTSITLVRQDDGRTLKIFVGLDADQVERLRAAADAGGTTT